MEIRNKKLKLSFIWYLITHKNERFWQAVANWSGNNYILKADFDSFEKNHYVGLQDTFYFEDKNQ